MLSAVYLSIIKNNKYIKKGCVKTKNDKDVSRWYGILHKGGYQTDNI